MTLPRRPMFINNDEVQKLSPGSTGHARQHVAHRGSDEIAQLNSKIAELQTALGSITSQTEAKWKGRVDGLEAALAAAQAEIVQLKTDLNKRVFSEFPDFSKIETAETGETETASETRNETGNEAANETDEMPWLAYDMTKPTYYRRKAKGTLPQIKAASKAR